MLVRGVLLLVCLASLASASGVAPGSIDSSGWAILRLHHEGESIVTVTALVDGRGGTAAINVLALDGSFLAGVEAHQRYGGFSVAAVDAQQGLDVRAGDPPRGTQRIEASLPFTGPPMEHFVLAWGAGDLRSLQWKIESRGSASLVATGRGSFYSDGFDAQADRHASARLGVAQAMLQEGGEIPFRIEGRFIGHSAMPPVSDGHDIRLENPDGRIDPCFCHHFVLDGPGSAGPGDYVLHHDAKSIDEFGPVVLVGVDVAWPLT